MNCPAKTEPIVGDGHNQNPDALAAELTTNSDFARVANLRGRWGHRIKSHARYPSRWRHDALEPTHPDTDIAAEAVTVSSNLTPLADIATAAKAVAVSSNPISSPLSADAAIPDSRNPGRQRPAEGWSSKALKIIKTYAMFVGPGFMISVAYIDPGNYATDVQAGATFRYKLLFVVLLSNFFAIFLQSLCIKLGTVTGLSMPQMVRAHWPWWLNYFWFFLSMAAIAATDVAEVIGTAIALNLLSSGKIPLIGACAMCFGDVFFILIFYRSSAASTQARRVFEFFVALLVVGVAISFGIQLGHIQDTSVGEVFLGFVPSSALVKGLGLYLSCGIVGATVMPHSLILGSGLVQSRLVEFDKAHGLVGPTTSISGDAKTEAYRPSLRAVRHCIWYSIADNCVSLLTFALFVNSAILIVAGASLSSLPDPSNASLFAIYDLLHHSLGSAVATMFAAALLLSGLSAGIIVTMAGQVAVEGHLGVRMRPWQLRLLIRAVSVPVSMGVAGARGKAGLATALVGSQVVLCILLPCIAAPLVWFTCQARYMAVVTDAQGRRVGVGERARRRSVDVSPSGDLALVETTEEAEREESVVSFKNHWITSGAVLIVWIFITVMNVAMLVLIALGEG